MTEREENTLSTRMRTLEFLQTTPVPAGLDADNVVWEQDPLLLEEQELAGENATYNATLLCIMMALLYADQVFVNPLSDCCQPRLQCRAALTPPAVHQWQLRRV